MSLYFTRPRRDEVRIGRGLPSGKMVLRVFIYFGSIFFLCDNRK